MQQKQPTSSGQNEAGTPGPGALETEEVSLSPEELDALAPSEKERLLRYMRICIERGIVTEWVDERRQQASSQ